MEVGTQMVMGPHAGLGNFPRAAEYSADWATALIRFARDGGLTRIEATAAGATGWTDHVIAASEGLLFTEVDSWMTGINRNVEGKQVRRIMRYSGGHPKFREHCEAVVAHQYRELSPGLGCRIGPRLGRQPRAREGLLTGRDTTMNEHG